jgi:hypothetical protein
VGIEESFLTHLGQVEIEQQPEETLCERDGDPMHTHALAPLVNLLERLYLTPEQRSENASICRRIASKTASP